MSTAKLEYYSDVKEGNLQNNIRNLIKKELPRFEGKRVTITIQKVKSKRTAAQNRLWWLYIGILSDELGYHKDEMHEICKFKFLKKEKVDEVHGEVFEYIGSTTDLSKSEFGELVDRLIQWAAENFNVVLPRPGEQVGFELE